MIRQVFKDESMSQTAVFKLHKLFKNDRESVEDEQIQSTKEVVYYDFVPEG